MTKYFKLIFWLGAVFALLLSGCDLLKPKEETPSTSEIKGLEATAATVAVGDTLKVKGTIEGSGNLLVKFYVMKGADTIKNERVKKVYNDSDGLSEKMKIDLAADAGLLLIPALGVSTPTACAGDYKLVVWAAVLLTADEIDDKSQSTAEHMFSITGPECTSAGVLKADVDTVTVTLGAQTATPPSALDLDDFSTYNRTTAKTAANSAKIDLYFANLATGGKTVMNPETAVLYGLYPDADSWPTANGTEFYELKSIGTADFGSIKTQIQIDNLWDGSETMLAKATATANKMYIAKTNTGKVVVFKVNSVAAEGTLSTVSITGYKAK